MGALTKAVGTAVVGIAAYFFITSALQAPTTPPPGYKPPGNAKRPDTIVFTIQYRPDREHGGPVAVPYSYTAGVITVDDVAVRSPTVVKAAVVDGAFWSLDVVAPTLKGERAEVKCQVHVNGKKVGEQPWTTRRQGCSMAGRVTL